MPVQHLLVPRRRLRFRCRLCHLWLFHDVVDYMVMQEDRLLTVSFYVADVEVEVEKRTVWVIPSVFSHLTAKGICF